MSFFSNLLRHLSGSSAPPRTLPPWAMHDARRQAPAVDQLEPRHEDARLGEAPQAPRTSPRPPVPGGWLGGFLAAWATHRTETRSEYYRNNPNLTDAQREDLRRDGAMRSILNNPNVPWN
jgi:hypothetical protein